MGFCIPFSLQFVDLGGKEAILVPGFVWVLWENWELKKKKQNFTDIEKNSQKKIKNFGTGKQIT